MESLRDRLAAIDGVVESPSMFKDALAYWVNGTEIAHFEGETAVDIRLTKAEIRAAKARLAGEPLVRRRAAGSDWVVVDVSTAAGADVAVELAARAAAVNRPPDGRFAEPPPTGGRLRSLRRFHVRD
jgi:hypothetical protein